MPIRSKVVLKASQAYDSKARVLKLDLHGCSILDAERIVPTKVNECYQTGTGALLIIYGLSKQDLGNAVHRLLQTAALRGVCGKRWSMAFRYGKYSRVENCSPEDSCVLVGIAPNAIPTKLYFSAFNTTYSGEVAGLDITKNADAWRFMVEPELESEITFPSKEKRRKLQAQRAFKPKPLKQKSVIFPSDWLRKK